MTKTPKDVSRHRRHTGGAPNGPASRHGLVPWLLRTLAALALLLSPAALNAQALKYLGTTPADGSSVTSLSAVELEFDLSEVIETFGEGDWGVCPNGFYLASLPQMEKTATLYEGTPGEGAMITRINSVCKPNNALFEVGNKVKFNFPDFEIKPAQEYTLVITYEFYAGKKGASTWEKTTVLSFQKDPLVLTFYGSEDANKVLDVKSSSIDENASYGTISEVKVSFNYDINLVSNQPVSLVEGDDLMAVSSSVEIDPTDPKTLLVSFPETTLYNNHTYQISVPAGLVAISGEDGSLNKEASIPVKGASYHYFGTGRVSPRDGSTTIMDEISIPFQFPELEEGTQYGFITLNNKKWYLHIYEGPTAEGEEVVAVATTEIGDDNQTLYFRPEFAFKAGTEYTLVIPEGDVLAYKVGGTTNSFLRDYLSERVELHYTTPTVEELPTWTPTLANLKDNDEVAELKHVIIDYPEYTCDRTDFDAVRTAEYLLEKDAFLYLVTEDGEELVSEFRMSPTQLRATSEIGNGEYVGLYFVGEVNETLYEGNTYKLVWVENAYRIDNAFIGQYVYNPEISVVLKGATPRGDETEFVTIGLNIGDYASVSYRMVKGQESVLDVKPGSDWKLESLSLNGEDVTADVAENGLYTLPALEADATLSAVYAYAHEIAYDYDTAVGNIEAVPFRLASDGNAVVITGLQGGETIAVYTLGGMKVAALDAVPADMHRATLTLPVGQAYIILVDGVAVKYRH